jgi:Domain of unknown function (DUF1981)
MSVLKYLTLVQVLQCLQQMIQARVQNMRSGWRTMFGVFSAASKVLTGTPGLLHFCGLALPFSHRTDNELRV